MNGSMQRSIGWNPETPMAPLGSTVGTLHLSRANGISPPGLLRHSCGYYLADMGTDLRTIQDYLGHRDPKHTAHYTRIAGHRFEGLWK